MTIRHQRLNLNDAHLRGRASRASRNLATMGFDMPAPDIIWLNQRYTYRLGHRLADQSIRLRRKLHWLARQEWIRQAALTLGLASQPDDAAALIARVVNGLVDGSERKQEL